MDYYENHDSEEQVHVGGKEAGNSVKIIVLQVYVVL